MNIKTRLATLCMYFIAICFFAWILPMFYQLLFVKSVDKTHMFYSPVDNNMIFTEQLLERDLKAEEKSENHHADVVYKNEAGDYFTRNEFEAKIPFIYYRNMELRGLLPLTLHGKSLDRAAIQKERRVFEMPSRLLDAHVYKEQIYPLMDANPGQVALVLPADRIRFTDTQLEFIDSDLNGVDAAQTKAYTKALADKGFHFPAKGIWGNFTTFKPFEGGTFVVDSAGKTFHLVRRNNILEVAVLPFPKDIIPQKMVIAEAKDRKYLGLVLDTQNRMYLMHQDDFALTHIPTKGYAPQHMDFKLIMDPLFMTAVYSDAKFIHAVAFANAENLGDKVHPLHAYVHQMSMSKSTAFTQVADIIFPFSISFEDLHSSKGRWKTTISAQYLGYGIVFNLLLALAYAFVFRAYRKAKVARQGLFIVGFGMYVLIPLVLMEQYKERN